MSSVKKISLEPSSRKSLKRLKMLFFRIFCNYILKEFIIKSFRKRLYPNKGLRFNFQLHPILRYRDHRTIKMISLKKKSL